MADFILILHLCFIIFVIVGGIFIFVKPRLAWIHLPMVLWAALVNFMGWVCPLTPLENFYREAERQPEYNSSFIEQYLTPVIYPNSLGDQLGTILGISVLAWNFLIYVIANYYLKHKNK